MIAMRGGSDEHPDPLTAPESQAEDSARRAARNTSPPARTACTIEVERGPARQRKPPGSNRHRPAEREPA